MQKDDYGSGLADIWRDFIDWEGRRKGESGFLKKVLEQNGCRGVFQSALGEGCDSIYLIKEGFEVVSNEISSEFLRKARENAKKESIKLEVTNFDWREIGEKMQSESFDAVLCLGNSLTHLFTKKGRLKALRGFYHILRKNGVLLIDERNYPYILDNKEEILNGNFRYSGKYVYCGKKVTGVPVKISNQRVVFQYSRKGFGDRNFLELYPFKKGEMLSLLKGAGFSQIEQYSDFKKGYNGNADFFIYVCRK